MTYSKPTKSESTYMWTTHKYVLPEKIQDRARKSHIGRDTSPRCRPRKTGRGRSL